LGLQTKTRISGGGKCVISFLIAVKRYVGRLSESTVVGVILQRFGPQSLALATTAKPFPLSVKNCESYRTFRAGVTSLGEQRSDWASAHRHIETGVVCKDLFSDQNGVRDLTKTTNPHLHFLEHAGHQYIWIIFFSPDVFCDSHASARKNVKKSGTDSNVAVGD
jgi:hypothetical protein